jgi:hypothetical protein
VKTHDHISARRRRDRESGQAMVEFALILFPLLILVGGIIWFGIGLNYWLDMQRIANQGARWAAVNNWPPDCPRGSAVGDCDGSPNPTLQETLKNQVLTAGLKSAVTVEVCYPSTTKLAGDPVKVHLEAPFTFVPILGIGTITLAANATMRLEQTQDPAKGGLITGEALPTC